MPFYKRVFDIALSLLFMLLLLPLVIILALVIKATSKGPSRWEG